MDNIVVTQKSKTFSDRQKELDDKSPSKIIRSTEQNPILEIPLPRSGETIKRVTWRWGGGANASIISDIPIDDILKRQHVTGLTLILSREDGSLEQINTNKISYFIGNY